MKVDVRVPMIIGMIFLTTLGALGCGEADKTAADDPYATLEEQGATLDCVPSCLKALAMECTGAGMCTVAATRGSNGTDGTSYSCYENGLKMTSTVAMKDGKNVTNVTATAGGSLCRQVELIQGTDGASYSVTDKAGAIIKARMTTYPAFTVTCGDQTTELDRSTPCGKLAILVLGGPKTPAVQKCALGACSP